MRRAKIYILFFILAYFCGYNILAQEAEYTYEPSEELVAAREGIDYSDEVVKEKKEEALENDSLTDFNFYSILRNRQRKFNSTKI